MHAEEQRRLESSCESTLLLPCASVQDEARREEYEREKASCIAPESLEDA